MPNWCENHLELQHSDPKMLAKAKRAIRDGRFFQRFRPCPKALTNTVQGFVGGEEQAKLDARRAKNVVKYGHESWYSWRNINWGTKWDIGEIQHVSIEGGTLSASFDTAWAPPTPFLRYLHEKYGFNYRLMYVETGMGFGGIAVPGKDTIVELLTEEAVDELREHFDSLNQQGGSHEAHSPCPV
jgi:hypothetical protein